MRSDRGGVQAGDTVALRPVGDAGTARHQLERGQLVAAYLPSQDQAGRLLVAGAQGTAVTQAVTGIFTAVAQGQGARLQVGDVVPLSAEDPRGYSGFHLTGPEHRPGSHRRLDILVTTPRSPRVPCWMRLASRCSTRCSPSTSRAHCSSGRRPPGGSAQEGGS